MELKVDPNRLQYEDSTGIYIRATLNGKWGSYDLAQLDKASVLAWIRSRDGDNQLAEDVVGILLGHGHLHDYEKKDEVKT